MRIKFEQLKRLRVQAGWTQEEVSARCKIDVRTYRKYERGEVNKGLSGLDAFNRSDQYDVLDRIAASFGLSGPEELIESESSAQPGSGDADVQVPLGPGSPFHPSWYVHREAAERKANNRLRSAGAPVVLQGPWLSGKATMLAYLLHRAQEPSDPASSGPVGLSPARVVHINLFDLDDTAFTGLDALLYAIGQRMLGSLGVPRHEAVVAEAWKSPASEKQKLAALMKRHALPPGQRLYFAVERADRLQGLAFMHDFFALLRGWAEAGLEDPWSRLRILATVATEPTLLEDTDHSSFFALANPIRLEDLDRAQILQLAALHQLQPSDAEIDALLALCGGHPYLCRTALYEALISEESLGEVLAGVDWTGGIFAQHLGHLRSWLRQVGLLPALGEVLDESGRALPFLDYCKLYSKGLVVEQARGVYRLRCKLYEDYFRALPREPGRRT